MTENANSQALTQEEIDGITVRCLVLPLNNVSLLVPNTIVAEVIEYRAADAAAKTPDWLTGMLAWRGRSVPVISFERLLGRATSLINEGRRYVVCNTLGGNPKLPFFALEMQGIPHLAMVDNSMLAYDSKGRDEETAVLAHLRLNEESVLVPDIDVLEKMLASLGIAG